MDYYTEAQRYWKVKKLRNGDIQLYSGLDINGGFKDFVRISKELLTLAPCLSAILDAGQVGQLLLDDPFDAEDGLPLHVDGCQCAQEASTSQTEQWSQSAGQSQEKLSSLQEESELTSPYNSDSSLTSQTSQTSSSSTDSENSRSRSIVRRHRKRSQHSAVNKNKTYRRHREH